MLGTGYVSLWARTLSALRPHRPRLGLHWRDRQAWRRFVGIGCAVAVLSLGSLSLPTAYATTTSSPNSSTAPINLTGKTITQDWPRWRAYTQHYIQDGRVVDKSDPRHITTSEGQSYALFFALVAGDRGQFQRVLTWTENNLAQGDLGHHLPAWLWGQQPDGSWGVLDANSASDSDLWIAYSLLEAGRLWQQRSYTVLGQLMLRNIAQQETAHIGQLGEFLLPGQEGFQHDEYVTLNPSYAPPQLIARAAHAQDSAFWTHLQEQLPGFLQQSAPLGIAPDWVRWGEHGPLAEQPANRRQSSYDAIRVYLWLGMLPPDFPSQPRLTQHFSPILQYLNADGTFPEHIDSQTGAEQGHAPSSFSLALLPLSRGEQRNALLQQLADYPAEDDAYYSQSLSMFVEGWAQGRYAFDAQGQLQLGRTP